MEKPVAKYLDSSLCCELSQTPLAISDKNLASLAARGNHLDVPEKVINIGADNGADFQLKRWQNLENARQRTASSISMLQHLHLWGEKPP